MGSKQDGSVEGAILDTQVEIHMEKILNAHRKYSNDVLVAFASVPYENADEDITRLQLKIQSITALTILNERGFFNVEP